MVSVDARIRELYAARHRALDAENRGDAWGRAQVLHLEREIDWWEAKEAEPGRTQRRAESKAMRRLIRHIDRVSKKLGLP